MKWLAAGPQYTQPKWLPPVPRVGDPSPLRGNDLPTATQLVGAPARNRAPWASPGPGHPLCLDILEKGHLAHSAQPERVGLARAARAAGARGSWPRAPLL